MSKPFSDNVNFDFPSKMSDGRTFTDYRPNCLMNNLISQNKDSFQYRYFLTNNAHKVASGNSQLMEKVNAYKGPITPEVPTQTIQNCTDGFCHFRPDKQNGIGLARENTFMK